MSLIYIFLFFILAKAVIWRFSNCANSLVFNFKSEFCATSSEQNMKIKKKFAALAYITTIRNWGNGNNYILFRTTRTTKAHGNKE